MLGAALAAALLSAQQQVPQQQRTAPSNAPSQQTKRPQFTATVKDGFLTVKAVDTSIDSILEQLTTGTGLAIERSDILGDRVTIQLENVPLELGLRELLKNHDAFFFYGAEPDAAAQLKVVWVYPKGRGVYLRPVPPSMWASTKELEELASDPDPRVRGEAIRDLLDRKRGSARDLVLKTLNEEQHEGVRATALHAATEEGIDIPKELLGNLALGDPSENVRFLTLEALGSNPDAKVIATAALNDTSPHVRQLAKQILARIERQGRQPQAQPPVQMPATQQQQQQLQRPR